MPTPNHRSRTTTTVRLDPGLHERVAHEAEARGWSINVFLVRATEHYLDALIPADEIRFTR